jgi:ribosomal protein S18 acetylase RimI-like enzyme
MRGGRTRRRSHPGVTVRRLRVAEAAEFRELRLRALSTDPTAFGSSYEREAQYSDERWSDWTKRGALSATEATWVAEAPDGRLVGMIGVFRADEVYHVWGLWVLSSHRGAGVGGALLDELIAWAGRSAPTSELKLHVAPSQRAAIRLYLSRGFLPTGGVEPLASQPGAIAEEFLRAPGPRTGQEGA